LPDKSLPVDLILVFIVRILVDNIKYFDDLSDRKSCALVLDLLVVNFYKEVVVGRHEVSRLNTILNPVNRKYRSWVVVPLAWNFDWFRSVRVLNLF
jgi:hypothetical protein